MTFSISEVYSNISRAGGLAKPSLFSIMITPPAFSQDQNAPRLIEFLADTAQLPGLTFKYDEIKNFGYGPTWKLPHTPIYSDIDVTIMMDNGGTVIEFFHQWMQNIVNINPTGNPSTAGYNGAKQYAVQYPSHYTTTITITLYSSAKDEIVVYTLNEAYPLRLGQPGLDWGATNSILRLPITFAYRTWTANTFKRNNQRLPDNISSFNPFARTLIDTTLYNEQSGRYVSLADIYTNTELMLLNNNTNGLTFNLYF